MVAMVDELIGGGDGFCPPDFSNAAHSDADLPAIAVPKVTPGFRCRTWWHAGPRNLQKATGERRPVRRG